MPGDVRGKRPAGEAASAAGAADEGRPASKKGRAAPEDVPEDWDDSEEGGVEVSIDEEDLPDGATELWLLANSIIEDDDSEEDDVAVAQKLLEMAMERFVAERDAAKGELPATTLYHYGQCLITLANCVLVSDLVTQALEVFAEAEKKLPDDGYTGPAERATAADVAAAVALAHVERARVHYVLSADDEDEDAASSTLLAALAEASALHTKCLLLIDTPTDKAEELLSFSRALLNFAQSDLDDDALDLRAKVLELAATAASDALTADAESRGARAQHAACLVAQSVCEGMRESANEIPLLERAVASLRGAIDKTDANAEAEQQQLLADALIRMGRVHPDDDKCDELISEGIACYRRALELQPDNRKLRQLVQMIEQMQQ